ncbi:MAG: cytidine deaminase [Clostridia bacterium]
MTNEDLVNIAKNAQKNAFAPVTKYQVGAALLAKSGTIYIGTNVEEYSILNLSNCAERVAIQNAISHGEREFETIAIVGGKNNTLDDTLVPCGVCLQYILDMCKNIDILTYIDKKLVKNKVMDFLNIAFELKDK